MTKNETKLKGIRGWLILPAIGLVVSLILSAYYLLESISYNNQFYLVIDSIFIIFNVVVIYNFWHKNKNILWMMPVFYLAGIAEYFITIASLEYGFIGYDFYVIAGGLFWVAYFIWSKRVENTFVN